MGKHFSYPKLEVAPAAADWEDLTEFVYEADRVVRFIEEQDAKGGAAMRGAAGIETRLTKLVRPVFEAQVPGAPWYVGVKDMLSALAGVAEDMRWTRPY